MLRMLDGRAVVRGEMPHVGLSHLSGVHTDRPWPWAYEVLVRKKRVLKVLNIDGVGEKPPGSLGLRHLAQLCTHKMTRGTPKSLALHHASPVHLMVNIKVPDPHTVEALTRAEWPHPVRYGFSKLNNAITSFRPQAKCLRSTL